MVDAENQKLKQENQQLVEQNELLSKELSEIREVLVDTVIELSTLKRTLNSRTK